MSMSALAFCVVLALAVASSVVKDCVCGFKDNEGNCWVFIAATKKELSDKTLCNRGTPGKLSNTTTICLRTVLTESKQIRRTSSGAKQDHVTCRGTMLNPGSFPSDYSVKLEFTDTSSVKIGVLCHRGKIPPTPCVGYSL